MRLHHPLAALCLSIAMCGSAPAQVLLPDPPAAALDPNGQISEYIREVFQDREGNLWLGTNGDGVCRYDGKALTYLSLKQGFGGSAVRGIVQDEAGAMWFATDGGVSRYQNGKFTNYTVTDGLSANSVWSLMLDKSGTIWAGTHEGVCRFDGKTFVPFPLPRVELENPGSRFTPKVVFAMIQDKAGNLWFGTDGEGAHKYDGKSFTSYTTKDGLAGNLVRSLREDRQGRIWIGSDGGGVSCYDGTTFRNFTEKDGLNNDRIFEILEDRAGNMWFSTLGAGACRYDGTSFTAFREDHNLLINGRPARGHVQEFCEDKDGNLWFGCSGGLFRLDGETIVNVTRGGPWPARKQVAAPAVVDGPMAPLARMVSGEWTMTVPAGTTLYSTWHWGPGRHSVRAMTDGSAADGTPWRAVQVFYWHPERKQVRLWGVSPYAGSVSEGMIAFEGENATADFDIYQTGVRRKLGLRWTFDGPDRYHEELLESIAGAPLTPLADWNHVRSHAPPAKRAAEEAPKPSERLKALEPLLGHTWNANGTWAQAADSAFHIETTFQWVPYADAIYVRSASLKSNGDRTHLLDAYIYNHTGTNRLRCLALSESGGVYEGDLTVLEGSGGGGLQLDLKGYEGNRAVPLVIQFDFNADGALRQRVWSSRGADRTLLLDARHTKGESRKD